MHLDVHPAWRVNYGWDQHYRGHKARQATRMLMAQYRVRRWW